MRNPTIIAQVLLVLSTLSAGCDGTPDDHGEVDLAIAGDPDAPYDSYAVEFVDISTGDLLLDRVVKPIAPPDSMGSSDTRLLAALPSDRALLIDVVALDASDNPVGGGAAVVTLEARKKTPLTINVVAQPTRIPGVLDTHLVDALLPERDYLVPDPAQNGAGGNQILVAHTTDTRSGAPVTDAKVLELDGTAPTFTLANDNAVIVAWKWLDEVVAPIDLEAAFAYLDAAGRGWIATASMHVEDLAAVSPIEIAWSGAVLATGTLAAADDGAWHIGLGDIPEAPHGVVYADADSDGDFDSAGEVVRLEAAGRIVVWVATDPTQIIMPIDIGGLLADTDNDGTLDTIVALGADGLVAQSPWPLD
jgi:hypothetical protein